VLLIGVGGLGAEVAKNIVLAGVRSLTLLDDQKACNCLYSSVSLQFPISCFQIDTFSMVVTFVSNTVCSSE